MYEVTKRGTARYENAPKTYEASMRECLKIRPGILDILIPDFPPLCKRLVTGPGYLEALTADHVGVIPHATHGVFPFLPLLKYLSALCDMRSKINTLERQQPASTNTTYLRTSATLHHHTTGEVGRQSNHNTQSVIQL